MLSKRIISAIIGIPLVIFIIISGGYPFLTVVGLVIILGMREYYQMMNHAGLYPERKLGYVITLLVFLSFIVIEGKFIHITLTFVILISLLIPIFQYRNHTFIDGIITLFGTLYIGWLLGHIVLMHYLPQGSFYILLSLFVTWIIDSGAYFAGSYLGKHKLCPHISPKKTIEGAFGGFLAGVISTVGFGTFWLKLPLEHMILMGSIVGIIAQLGDLAESALKRYADIKDSGNIIPGHGGILDRVDSILFVIPTVYYYLKYFVL